MYSSILNSNSIQIDAIIANKKTHYRDYEISKKDGVRKLNCIEKSELYTLQRRLVKRFLNRIPIADNVFGFVNGCSYYDFMKPHVNFKNDIEKYKTLFNPNFENNEINKYYLRIDIKDFFGSIKSEFIKNALSEYIVINDKQENEIVLNQIVELVTLDGVLPQGAVTSPVISNIVFRRFDLRIQNYCKRLNVIFTRYADDLLFSSYNKKLYEYFFIGMIGNIIKEHFQINPTKIKKSINEISLNGFVVGENIRLSRKKRKGLTEFIYKFYLGGKPKDVVEFVEKIFTSEDTDNSKHKKVNLSKRTYLSTKEKILHILSGYRSFLIDWLPDKSDNENYMKAANFIKRIEDLINDIINLEYTDSKN